MKKKIIFFGDSNSFITSILFKSFLKSIDNNYELVAIVNTTKKLNFTKKRISNFIKKLFNPYDKNQFVSFKSFINLTNEKIIDCQDVNSKNFIKELWKLKPDYAFLMGCPQIFKKNTIEIFECVINYHNSYLPYYRGLNATSWEMTNGEKYSGYSFHYVSEKIDDGNIVLQDKMKLDYSKTSTENEIHKTILASRKVCDVINLVFKNFKGFKQEGKPSYYGEKEKNELLRLKNINDINYVRNIIKYWGFIEYIKEGNDKILVTKIDINGKIKRIQFLPPFVYKIYRILKQYK